MRLILWQVGFISWELWPAIPCICYSHTTGWPLVPINNCKIYINESAYLPMDEWCVGSRAHEGRWLSWFLDLFVWRLVCHSSQPSSMLTERVTYGRLRVVYKTFAPIYPPYYYLLYMGHRVNSLNLSETLWGAPGRIKVGCHSWHHRWLFWGLNLAACKSSILTAKLSPAANGLQFIVLWAPSYLADPRF